MYLLILNGKSNRIRKEFEADGRSVRLGSIRRDIAYTSFPPSPFADQLIGIPPPLRETRLRVSHRHRSRFRCPPVFAQLPRQTSAYKHRRSRVFRSGRRIVRPFRPTDTWNAVWRGNRRTRCAMFTLLASWHADGGGEIRLLCAVIGDGRKNDDENQ